MINRLLRSVACALILLPAAAAAEPVKLKLAFYSSDRSALYQSGVKPFVNAVNQAAKDLIHIDVHFSSELGPVSSYPQAVLDGTIDIAFMIPGYSPKIFYDTAVVELPGQFRDAHEATLVYTRLAGLNAFKSFDNFVVLGTYASEPQSIHSRKRIATMADLKGLKVRVNNTSEGAAIEKLGGIPDLIPINKTSDAISRGDLDAAMAPPAMLFEFGIGRVTANHYMMRGSAALMLLAMNRQTFDRLPAEAQKTIRQHSGAWLAARYIDTITALNASVLEQLSTDPKRNLVFPDPPDRTIKQRVYDSVAQDWAGTDLDRIAQLNLLRKELATVRASESSGSDARR